MAQEVEGLLGKHDAEFKLYYHHNIHRHTYVHTHTHTYTQEYFQTSEKLYRPEIMK
jgi:hypothetical protein